MKILMVLEGQFPPDDRVEKEALVLINEGHEVHLLCTSFTPTIQNETYKGIFIHRLICNTFLFKKSKGSALTLPFYFMFWKKHIFSLMHEISADAIHIHDLPLAKVGVQAKRKFKCHITLDLHENYPYLLETAPYSQTIQGKLLMPIKKWIAYEKQMVDSFDNVIVTAKEMGERIKDLCPASTYTVVENTLSEELFPKPVPYNKHDAVIRMVYIGGVEKHRGINFAVEGFVEALKSNPNLEFHIHGKGRYVNTLLNIAKENNIENKFFFNPLLKFPEDAVKLSYYDIGLIPHIRSVQNDCSSPNKLYQYMYYGLAVLSSDCNSLKRVIEETETGFTYLYDSPQDFADQLKKMTPSKLNAMKKNGLTAVKTKYNWKVSTKGLIQIYASSTV